MLRRRKIVRALKELLEQVEGNLPSSNIQDAQELIDHGEWLLGLDLICTQLYEHERPLSPRVLSLVEEAAQLMKISADKWSYLRELLVEARE